ncbi:sigma factor-like helix-turn-helix DNA-binding protein [Acetobacterium carbinolicum]|uniref:sigma factor-like helix-turn-helix DNA-binding protein n=1 Tax=Acetobacterium carbinolicum TaxID=52690 RepID=UPI0039BFB22E
MQVRSFFEKYMDNKIAIIFIDREIKLLREQIDPSYTQQLSHTPIVHVGGSSTERTAIRHLEDEEILELQKKKKLAEADIEVVDRLMPMMSPELKSIIENRYFKKLTWREIADKMELDERTVQKKIEVTLDQLDMISMRESACG